MAGVCAGPCGVPGDACLHTTAVPHCAEGYRSYRMWREGGGGEIGGAWGVMRRVGGGGGGVEEARRGKVEERR